MNWDDWQSIIQHSVYKYRQSEKHRADMSRMKKELKYLELQEAHNKLYRLIVVKDVLELTYVESGDYCEAILFQYPMYQILGKYRMYWLFNSKIERVENIYELLDKFLTKTLKCRYGYSHSVDYANNYQCSVKLKVYDVSAKIREMSNQIL